MSLRSWFVLMSFSPEGGGLSRHEAVVCEWLCSCACRLCAVFRQCARQHASSVPRLCKQRRVLARGVALIRVDEDLFVCSLVLLVEVVQRFVEQKMWSRCWFGG